MDKYEDWLNSIDAPYRYRRTFKGRVMSLWPLNNDIQEVVKDMIEHVVSEVGYYNRKGELVGYWAYGSFDPSGPYRG